jgi:broad specificity phosphatase PhoE
MPTLHLVRHAQPDFHGHYDSVTQLGLEQAAWLGSHFAALGLKFERVISGALMRQRETLRRLCAELPQSPEPQVDARFDEYDARQVLARFLGRSDTAMRRDGDRRAYFSSIRQALLAWSADSGSSDDGESWAQFGARIGAAVADAQRGLERDARILVVTSGGVIGRFVADTLGADAAAAIALNLQARNTGVTEVVLGRSATRLISFNAIPHLERADRIQALTYS